MFVSWTVLAPRTARKPSAGQSPTQHVHSQLTDDSVGKDRGRVPAAIRTSCSSSARRCTTRSFNGLGRGPGTVGSASRDCSGSWIPTFFAGRWARCSERQRDLLGSDRAAWEPGYRVCGQAGRSDVPRRTWTNPSAASHIVQMLAALERKGPDLQGPACALRVRRPAVRAVHPQGTRQRSRLKFRVV